MNCEIFGKILIFFGCFFILTSIAGFIKFKDVFRMVHVGGVCDLVGAPLVICGCGFIMLSHGNIASFYKTIFISILSYLIAPVHTNAISEAACKIYQSDVLQKIEKNNIK